MDKITHQVRAEHWAKIMNECINSGMSKTAWCRANGVTEKQCILRCGRAASPVWREPPVRTNGATCL